MSEDDRAFISYAEFGEQFFVHAVTRERILAGVKTLAGQPIDFGPLGVGPGRIAKVTARGAIGEATAQPVAGQLVTHRVTLPVELDFDVHLQVDTHHFKAALEVPLLLVARAAAPLTVVVDVMAPRADEVSLELTAGGLRASVLNRVVGVEDELRRFVAKYVAREVEKPAVLAARTIDVASAIDGAYATISRPTPG